MPQQTTPRAKLIPCVRHHTRACGLLCAVSILALATALVLAPDIPELEFISSAHAQQTPDAATQELFLALDRNNLEQVRAAIAKGADVQARDFTGTQPVDIAIDRGYFDIAHYLISVRNAAQAKQGGMAAAPTPSPEQLAQTPGMFKAPSDVIAQQSALPAQPDAVIDPFELPAAPDVPAIAAVDTPAVTPDAHVTETPQPEIPLAETPLQDAALPETALNRTVGDPFAVEPEAQIPPAERAAEMEAPREPAPDVPAQAPILTLDAPPADEPATEPAGEPAALALQADPPQAAQPAPPSASATKRFFTTFLDFFKPPNVTGVTRREEDRKEPESGLSDQELAQQLQEIEAERGDAVIKGPDVPISPEELAKELPPSPTFEDLPADELAALSADTPELPPYSVSSPQTNVKAPAPGAMISPDDAFANLEINDATAEDEQPLQASTPILPEFKEAPGVPGKRYDSRKPFGGGVDPDILAYLGLDERTGEPAKPSAQKQQDTAAPQGVAAQDAAPKDASPVAMSDAPEDPFASPFETLEGAKAPELTDLLEGLGEPKSVASAPPQSPPPPGGAAKGDDVFGGEALGLEIPAQDTQGTAAAPQGDVNELAGLLESTGESVKGTKGWDVTKVEGADMPDAVTVLTDIEPTGEILDGVELALGTDTVIGKEVGADRMLLLEQKTIHKPCVAKGDNDTIFCIDKVTWPFELNEDFLVDTIMYQGTRAIGRYDAGRATNFHSLFRSEALPRIIGYYTKRYGHPTKIVERAIAPLAAPRQANPTYLWQSREPGTDTITTLEIRKFDDAQSGFPDTKRGALLLYRSHAKPIFPQLSQLELMVLKADATAADNGEAPSDPGNIWN